MSLAGGQVQNGVSNWAMLLEDLINFQGGRFGNIFCFRLTFRYMECSLSIQWQWQTVARKPAGGKLPALQLMAASLAKVQWILESILWKALKLEKNLESGSVTAFYSMWHTNEWSDKSCLLLMGSQQGFFSLLKIQSFLLKLGWDIL